MKKCVRCKTVKSSSEFYEDKKSSDGKHSWCKRCCVVAHNKWAKQHPEKMRYYRDKWREANREKYLLSARKYYKKQTLWLNTYKIKRGCFICGYKVYAEALDFHHKSPQGKLRIKFHISSMTNRKKIEKELTKCVVVCANCHRLIHANIITLPKNRQKMA